MHSNAHLLRNTKVTVPKSSNISFDQFLLQVLMEFNSKVRESHANQPVFLSENYIKPCMKNDIPFDVPTSTGTCLQEFDHHLDHHQFHATGWSSSNPPVFGVQTSCLDSFEASSYNYLSNFDLYECKPYAESNGGHGQVMDNFQSGGYINHHQVNPVNMVESEQTVHMPLDFQEMRPVNFAIPDEVSRVSAEIGCYKKAAMNRNNGPYPIARRTMKTGKKSHVVKGQWTNEEDRLLIRLVDQYGIRKWSHIAQMLTGRIGKQCRERWHNHLRPDIKKDTWSEEEDKGLIEAHAEIGNKWAEIAKRLPGRTENSIKNHWNATKRRQFSKRKCRSKYPRASLLQDYIKSLNLDSSSSKHQRKTSSSATATAGNTNNNNTKCKSQNQPPADQEFCPSDHLVPDFDFKEVPEFDFDDKLFEENCSIDSFIEGMPCAPVLDEKSSETGMPFDTESEGNKKLDLVEMISQANL